MDDDSEFDEQEILYRLDGRTERINHTVNRMERRLDHQRDEIAETKEVAKNNETKINAGTFVGGSAITALFTKVAGVLPW